MTGLRIICTCQATQSGREGENVLVWSNTPWRCARGCRDHTFLIFDAVGWSFPPSCRLTQVIIGLEAELGS